MKKMFFSRSILVFVGVLVGALSLAFITTRIPALFAQTFLMEDFNAYADGDLNGKGGWSGDSVFKVQGTTVYEGAKALKITGTGGTTGAITKAVTGTADGTLSWRIRRSNTAGSVMMYLRDFAGNAVANLGARHGTAQSIMYYDYVTDGFTAVAPYSVNTWHLLQMEWRSSDYKVRYRVDAGAWTSWVPRTFNTTASPAGVLLVIETGGLNSGDVAFYDDFRDIAAPAEINVKQGATAIASGGAFDYGGVTVGQTLDKEFTIENIGQSNVTLTGTPLVAVSGAGASSYSVTVMPTTPVAPAGITTFTVRFTPPDLTSQAAQISIANNDADENPYIINLTGTGSAAAPGGGQSPWNTQGSLIYYTNGSVGIGTSAVPSGYALAVDGKVLAEEIEVKLANQWPDYVFANNYTPLPLDELEQYIEEHHHLPGVPTQEEIAETGIALGEMQRIMTEKIEELTVYVIELKKENEALQMRFDAMEEKNIQQASNEVK